MLSSAQSPREKSPKQSAKAQRVLSCMSCQQKKVKCDRNNPCTNCTKSKLQCVPATSRVARQRRRRFPERELLDRLRHYEALLRGSNVKFEPLHDSAPATEKESFDAADASQVDEQPRAAEGADQSFSSPTRPKAEPAYEANPAVMKKSIPRLMIWIVPDRIREAWNELYCDNSNLLFGSSSQRADVSTLHPEQIQIFRLWQIYLDNVNPLLKVTHTPTLQARFIDAASDTTRIKPELVALMFSIYCVSIMSLSEDECSAMFGSSKETLSARYNSGCQQALVYCGFLRSVDRDCLTALFLYLISIRSAVDPESLSSMLGVAIRIAQRMGMHHESSYGKHSVFEAELRRRLWWSLVLFDTRICGLAGTKTSTLNPTWDCRTPLNLNDFELQGEIKELPQSQKRSSEAVFPVVCSALGDFVRHSAFHLDFVNPALKAMAREVQTGENDSGISTLEKEIEEKYLGFCSPENPLQFMTIWTARGFLARYRLLKHYADFAESSARPTAVQREAALCHAVNMLECDTRIVGSSVTRGYTWYSHFHFPFLAYMHLAQELSMRPLSERTDRIWAAMSDNYDAQSSFLEQGGHPLFKLFGKVILQAWKARETATRQRGNPLVPPSIVSKVKQRMVQRAQAACEVREDDLCGRNADPSISLSMDSGFNNLNYGLGGQGDPGLSLNMLEQPLQDHGLDQFDWTSMDWNPLYR